MSLATHTGTLAPSHTSSPNHEALLDRLDGLSAAYLDRLEAYQAARKQLSCMLGAGFFSLAQANFRSTSRMRFGQDYYDERMRAIRTVEVVPTAQTWNFAIATRDPPLAQPETDAKVTVGSLEGQAEEEKSQQQSDDPLRWFGILVPPSLRDSQRSFSLAVEGPVTSLATISGELRSLEVQMGRLKKEIRKAD